MLVQVDPTGGKVSLSLEELLATARRWPNLLFPQHVLTGAPPLAGTSFKSSNPLVALTSPKARDASARQRGNEAPELQELLPGGALSP